MHDETHYDSGFRKSAGSAQKSTDKKNYHFFLEWFVEVDKRWITRGRIILTSAGHQTRDIAEGKVLSSNGLQNPREIGQDCADSLLCVGHFFVMICVI